MKRENRPGLEETSEAGKRRPGYSSSSSSSSDYATVDKREGSQAKANATDQAGVPDQIQVYREQIAQIKKLISGTSHQATKAADAKAKT